MKSLILYGEVRNELQKFYILSISYYFCFVKENEIKYLFIRFSSIGDIVLTSPIIRCVKQQVKGAIIHFVTKPQYAALLETNPYIDKVHVLTTNRETINELREEGFDYIIDLHKNLRSHLFKSKLKIVDFSFPKLNKEKWQMVHFKKNVLPNMHIVDRYFESVRLFDVVNDNKGLDFFIKEDDNLEHSDFMPSANSKFVAFAIGGQHFTKKLPTNKIIEICNGIKHTVVLLGGKEDVDSGNEISLSCKNTINLCGKYNISQSADIIRLSNLVIAHDTGLMHIAAAFKKNILSIWGNTIPEFGMYPYLPGNKSEIFEIKDIKCRPCSKIGFSKCPKKHFDCMNNQDSAKIYTSANTILQ